MTREARHWIRGRVERDRETKRLVARLRPGDIAVLDHPGLDRLAAESLIRCRVAAVVNSRSSLSRSHPNEGPEMLLRAGVTVLDDCGRSIWDVRAGAVADIRGDELWQHGRCLVRGRRLTREQITAADDEVRRRQGEILRDFVSNSLARAQREQEGVLCPAPLPRLRLALAGRPCLVVVRGPGYRDDLRLLARFIRARRPVRIGVDGGADALLEMGWRPDLIVGDMDSVSDRALVSGAELAVHAYPDGRAPGLERVARLGLTAHALAVPGTSEDAALILADALGASPIVAVGTHTGAIDFLEKGRAGMAATLLVRMKLGSRLIDLSGISRLSEPNPPTWAEWSRLAAAALVPVGLVAALDPAAGALLRLTWLSLRLAMGV